MKKFILLTVVILLSARLVGAEGAPAFSSPFLNVPTNSTESVFNFSPQGLKKPVLMVFWASWCKPCILEVPDAIGLFREHEKTIDIVGVSVDKEKTKAEGFIKKYALPYGNVHDPDMALSEKMGVQATPALVLIGADGQVKYRAIRIDKKLKSQLAKLSP